MTNYKKLVSSGMCAVLLTSLSVSMLGGNYYKKMSLLCHDPKSITVTANGKKLFMNCVQQYADHIKFFSYSGGESWRVKVLKVPNKFGGHAYKPNGLAVDPDGKYLYIINQYNGVTRTIGRYELINDEKLKLLNTVVTGNKDIVSPRSIAVDSKQSVYYTWDDDHNKFKSVIRKYVFLNGEYGFQCNIGAGELKDPQGIAVDRNGDNVFVSDNNGIYKYTRVHRGKGLDYEKTACIDKGKERSYLDVAVDKYGNLYAVTNFGRKICKYAPRGDSYELVDTVKITFCRYITVDDYQNIYTAGGQKNNVYFYNKNGYIKNDLDK